MRYISGQRSISFDGNRFDPLQIENRQTERIEGSVTLPIPGGISDKNSVKFEGENLNVLQAAGVGAILNPVAAAQSGADFLRNAMTMTPDQSVQLLLDQSKDLISFQH